ncbi:MAG: carbohydrate-binding protein, partial [Armatimonadota bacterium]|nr:carbohydrate-binding protein [Armatimonadota bacterium]
DGNSGDWNLSEFTTPIKGGDNGSGDYALVGFDGGSLHYGGYNTGLVLPTSAADHTAKVYSRHDSMYQYFLVNVDDSDVRTANPTGTNWANDCVEIYIDPSHDHGAVGIDNSSSDLQLVVDAAGRVNVYMTTAPYATQILAGVTAAAISTGTGWQAEVRILKSALDPDMPTSGTFGVDFIFRDNDNPDATNYAGNPAQSTFYGWHDPSTGSSFCTKVPDNWGDAFQTPSGQTPYAGVIAIPGVVQAENYDNGGEGIAYHDTTAGNSGGVYRTNDVDIEACSDTGGGYDINSLQTGEWLAYTVNVASTGGYDIKMRVAATGAGGSFRVEMNGADITGTRGINATGGSQTWANVIVSNVNLSAGQQILRVVAVSGGWSLNYVDIPTTSVQPVNWNTLGAQQMLGDGATPGVAVDSQGNIHVVYMANGGIYYKQGNSSMVFGPAEQIPSPEGPGDYVCPSVKCDSANVPHVAFQRGWAGECHKNWYSNRIGGSWKTPVKVIDNDIQQLDGRANYPRLALYGSYAFVSTFGVPGEMLDGTEGTIVRVTNLSTTPVVDRTAYSRLWVPHVLVATDGRLFVAGRYGTAGVQYQQYDLNLNTVGGLSSLTAGIEHRPGEENGECIDLNNVIHTAGGFNLDHGTGVWLGHIFYNSSARVAQGKEPIVGLESTISWDNIQVYPVTEVDRTGKVYISWRADPAGEGKITIVNGDQYQTPAVYAPAVTQYMRWNPQIAVAPISGIYAVWDYAGKIYIRSIGVGVSDDSTPPGPVTNLTAAPGQLQITVSWTNPADTDFTAAMIRYKTTGYPTNETDGTLLADKVGTPGANDSYVHTGLTTGVTYYYSVFAHDGALNYSTKVDANATPLPDSTPPGSATNFSALGGSGLVNLSWTNPADSDFTKTMIRFKTTGYPTGVSDGVLVVDKAGTPSANDSYIHTGLSNGVTYYYSAFAHDAGPNYATKVNAMALTIAGDCFSETFTYSDGNLPAPWSPTCTSMQVASQTLRINGGSGACDTLRTTSCSGTNGIIIVKAQIKGGVGSQTMWSLYINDPSDNNLARWYGGGMSARPRIGGSNDLLLNPVTLTGGGIWDDLEVRINTTTNIDEFFFNGTSLGTLSHASTGAGNTVGKISIQHTDNINAAGHYMYFDNIIIVESQDTVAPGPVSAFTATSGDRRVTLNWTNPTDSDFIKTMIRYKTTWFPTSATDGALLVDKLGTPGMNDSYAHISLTNGTTYYYSAFAHDSVPNYSTKVDRSAVPADVIAPASVTNFNIIIGDQKNYLSWTKPTDTDLAGVKILAKTESYPANATDGTVAYTGTGTNTTHISLTNGTMQYYSAFAYDEVPNYSVKADISGTPTYVDPAGAKILANSVPVTLTAGIVSAFFADSFYVQCSDKPIGIRVDKAAHGLTLGQTAWARGTAETDAATGEKYLSATWAQGSGTGSVSPYALANMSLGGVDWSYDSVSKAGQAGVFGGLGPNNIGLLVRVWGKVTQREDVTNTYFYIDDGSGLKDGTKTLLESLLVDNVGVKVKASPVSHDTGEYLVITGLSSVFKDGSENIIRQVTPITGGILELPIP